MKNTTTDPRRTSSDSLFHRGVLQADSLARKNFALQALTNTATQVHQPREPPKRLLRERNTAVSRSQLSGPLKCPLDALLSSPALALRWVCHTDTRPARKEFWDWQSLKIPVWWRRAVLPSLPWVVRFLSFFGTGLARTATGTNPGTRREVIGRLGLYTFFLAKYKPSPFSVFFPYSCPKQGLS